MVSYQVRQQCERHNRELRRVVEYNRFPLDHILWGEGNLLLTGGQVAQRQDILIRLVRHLRQQPPERPLFLFTASAEVERELIGLARAGYLGTLRVISPEYPNYDVFYGMPSVVIADCLTKIAGGDEGLYSYALAFLSLLDRAGTLSLSNMVDFARNTDAAIAGWAQDCGLLEERAQIMGSSQGGIRFRSALRMVSLAFSSLTREGCAARFSLTTATDVPCAVCLRADAVHPEVLAAYFSYVFQSLLGQGRSFTVILDEPPFLRHSAFSQSLAALKQSPLTMTAVSVENAAAFGGEEFLSNFSREIILLGGGRVGSSDMQWILDGLGSYPHFEPAKSASGPPRLLGLRPVGDSILTYTRSKVLVEETEGFQAVLRGHRGAETGMARRLEV